MSGVSQAPVTKRHILLVGPYGVLGTGVVDAVAENPKWGITTAARRPVPTYRAQAERKSSPRTRKQRKNNA